MQDKVNISRRMFHYLFWGVVALVILAISALVNVEIFYLLLRVAAFMSFVAAGITIGAWLPWLVRKVVAGIDGLYDRLAKGLEQDDGQA